MRWYGGLRANNRLVFYAGATSRGIDGTVWSLTLGAPVWNGVIVTPHPPSSPDEDYPVVVDGDRIVVYVKQQPDELWSLPLACF